MTYAEESIANLMKSDAGRSALLGLRTIAEGPALDEANRMGALGLIAGMHGPYAGTVRALVSEAAERVEKEAGQ